MPPKTLFDRDAVLRAATELVEREGISALTARRAANELGGSTAPLYSQFGSLGKLKRSVMTQAQELLRDYMSRPHTDRPFLDMGVGVVLFARDHGNLYRALFVESAEFKDIVDDYLERATEDMRRDPRFRDMPKAERQALLRQMWIFTHGLASLLTVGLIDDPRPKALIRLLADTGAAVIERSHGDEPNPER